jgi:hypothetical protein
MTGRCAARVLVSHDKLRSMHPENPFGIVNGSGQIWKFHLKIENVNEALAMRCDFGENMKQIASKICVSPS